MIEINEKEQCSGCHGCVNICPQKCIEMKEDTEGFWYPQLDKEKCIECGLCEKVCPIINSKKPEGETKAYACMNKDEDIRMQSSSGGVFSLLAQYVIECGGIVYGAAFDENFSVKHIEITKQQDIRKLRGSKYVQSKIGRTYQQVKEHLKSGKLVYFSGTPCQIDGLLSFLQKPYDNLICQDIVCHGVPSPKVWEKYLNEKSETYKEKPIAVKFREKSTGWNNYSVSIQYANKLYSNSHRDDIYMKAFLGDMDLRPSCYACHSKSIKRNADITLADFWGIDNIAKEMNDNKGTSLILLHSEKGKKLFEKIKENIELKEVDVEDALKYNRSAYKSVAKPKIRNKFFDMLDESSLENYIEKVSKISISERIKRKIYLQLYRFYDKLKG